MLSGSQLQVAKLVKMCRAVPSSLPCLPELEPELEPKVESKVEPELEPVLEPELKPKLEPVQCSWVSIVIFT